MTARLLLILAGVFALASASGSSSASAGAGLFGTVRLVPGSPTCRSLIVFAVVVGLLGAVFGVLMAFLSVGLVALKIALVVLVPVLILAWVARRIFGSSQHVRM